MLVTSVEQKNPKYTEIVLRVLVTLIAIAAAIVHVLFPKSIPDLLTGGLIVLAMLPWLSPLIKSVEVTGLGKLEFKVDEVKVQQGLLQEQVDSLRFLVSGFVTEWEFDHLTKLAGDGPFEYRRGLAQDDRFTGELIRLRDFGLITKRGGGFVREIPDSGDLKQYFELTERGRTYLKLRTAVESSRRA